MFGAEATYVLIVVFTFLARAESGYRYQAPGNFQQTYQHFANTGQVASFNTHQSVSYQTVQGNSIRDQNNVMQQHGNYQTPNSLYNFNYHSELSSNINSGLVQNTHQSFETIHARPAQPIVTKHVYFHVPPPDIEEKPVVPLSTTNRKKKYNILFIAVPSPKPKYFVNSQGVRINPYTGVEDKTLIYVLVKKPQDQSEVLPKPSPPNHEVFFVKYKGNVKEATSQINSGISHQTSLQNLRPGLVNGQ